MNHQESNWVENELGFFIHAMREAKGYTMEEISDGICSITTLSRIEAGERTIDFLVMEALMDRMKILKSEYEFVLDEDDYSMYMQREKIKMLIKTNEYILAEKEMEEYKNTHIEEPLHEQFLFYQKAILEKKNGQKEKAKELFLKAVLITAIDFDEKIKQRNILSNLELSCVVEMISCDENFVEKEESYAELYEYFQWCRKREGFFPVPYRFAMQYYAECLYANKKYEKCIQICDEVMKVLFETSRVENRNDILYIRAKAQEGKGFKNEEEKEKCLKDFLTVYYLTELFEGKEKAKDLRQYIGETYGWQFIE